MREFHHYLLIVLVASIRDELKIITPDNGSYYWSGRREG
jgi:hypothetical protein